MYRVMGAPLNSTCYIGGSDDDYDDADDNSSEDDNYKKEDNYDVWVMNLNMDDDDDDDDDTGDCC